MYLSWWVFGCDFFFLAGMAGVFIEKMAPTLTALDRFYGAVDRAGARSPAACEPLRKAMKSIWKGVSSKDAYDRASSMLELVCRDPPKKGKGRGGGAHDGYQAPPRGVALWLPNTPSRDRVPAAVTQLPAASAGFPTACAGLSAAALPAACPSLPATGACLPAAGAYLPAAGPCAAAHGPANGHTTAGQLPPGFGSMLSLWGVNPQCQQVLPAAPGAEARLWAAAAANVIV